MVTDVDFPDRRKEDLPTEYRRRRSDVDPSYEWMLKQIRNSLTTSADSAGEISALNKDFSALKDEVNNNKATLEVLKSIVERDGQQLRIDDKSLSDKIDKLDLKLDKFQNNFSPAKIISYTIGGFAVLFGLLELVLNVIKVLKG